jgi:hypothetical protein
LQINGSIVKFDNIPNAAKTNVLQYDTTTKQISYAAGGGGGTIPDPLQLNTITANTTLSASNSFQASSGNVKLTNIPNNTGNNQVLYYNSTNGNVSYSGTPSFSVPDPLTVNTITANTSFTASNSLQATSGNVKLTNIPNNTGNNQILYYDSTNGNVSYSAPPSTSVPDPLTLGTITANTSLTGSNSLSATLNSLKLPNFTIGTKSFDQVIFRDSTTGDIFPASLDPLTLQSITANTKLVGANVLDVSTGQLKLTNISSGTGNNNVLYYNSTTGVVTFAAAPGGGGGGAVPDPLTLNSITASISLTGANSLIAAFNSLQLPNLSTGAANFDNVLFRNPSSKEVYPASLDPLSLSTITATTRLVGANSLEATTGAVKLTNISSGTGNNNILYYNSTNGNVSFSTAPSGGGRTAYSYSHNCLTQFLGSSLWTTTNTLAKIPIFGLASPPVAGTNYAITVNNGFTADVSNQRIIYNGVSGRSFHIHVSFAITAGATVTFSFQTVRYASAAPTTVIQGSASRASIVGTHTDAQDFNIFQLDNNDFIEIWGATSTTTNVITFNATNTGFGITQTPKPFQILINEILTP